MFKITLYTISDCKFKVCEGYKYSPFISLAMDDVFKANLCVSPYLGQPRYLLASLQVTVLELCLLIITNRTAIVKSAIKAVANFLVKF